MWMDRFQGVWGRLGYGVDFGSNIWGSRVKIGESRL